MDPRATNSFPVPLSPRINTGADVGATCLISEKICCIAGETPTRSPRTPRRLKSRFQFLGFLQASLEMNRAFQKSLKSSRLYRFLQEPECLRS